MSGMTQRVYCGIDALVIGITLCFLSFRDNGCLCRVGKTVRSRPYRFALPRRIQVHSPLVLLLLLWVRWEQREAGCQLGICT